MTYLCAGFVWFSGNYLLILYVNWLFWVAVPKGFEPLTFGL